MLRQKEYNPLMLFFLAFIHQTSAAPPELDSTSLPWRVDPFEEASLPAQRAYKDSQYLVEALAIGPVLLGTGIAVISTGDQQDRLFSARLLQGTGGLLAGVGGTATLLSPPTLLYTATKTQHHLRRAGVRATPVWQNAGWVSVGASLTGFAASGGRGEYLGIGWSLTTFCAIAQHISNRTSILRLRRRDHRAFIQTDPSGQEPQLPQIR